MLRTRLTLGLMCLLVILLSMGLYSIDRCSDLGKRLQNISADNDRAGRSIQQMRSSGAAMTGALLSLVTEDHDQAKRDFDAANKNFEKALNEEEARTTADKNEKNLIAKLGDTYKVYAGRAQAFLQAPNETDVSWRLTAARLGQNTAQLLELVDQLAVAHQQGVDENGKTSAEDINSVIKSLILLMIAAVATAIYASISLSRGLLNPLIALTSSIQQVGAGNLDQKVPVLSNDELGTLATSFNQMAAQLKQYRTHTSVELMRLNMTIRSTLASFPDPIFVLNSQGEVEFRNPEADQLAMKLLFSGVTRLPQNVDEKVEQVRASGHDYLPTLFKDTIKFYLDGQDRYFLPRIILLRDDKQEVFGVAVILEDVTRMRLLDDIKSNLIATVSHELKTPLTSVRMVLYLLHEKNVGTLNDRQAELVSTAREDADRLLRTLNDLLDLAKLEQGPSLLQMVYISPVELVNTAVHNVQEVAAMANVTLKTELAPGLPNVYLDPQRVAYVFANLLTNAIKYSPKDSVVLARARMGQTHSGNPCVQFSIIDQGPGISEEHQKHIFDRFYRVPGTTKTGAGLGLFIAREIVGAHHGEIGVISSPGHGSEFYFNMPVTLREEKESKK